MAVQGGITANCWADQHGRIVEYKSLYVFDIPDDDLFMASERVTFIDREIPAECTNYFYYLMFK